MKKQISKLQPAIGICLLDSTDRDLLSKFLVESGYSVNASPQSLLSEGSEKKVDLILAGAGFTRENTDRLLRLKGQRTESLSIFPVLILENRPFQGSVWLEKGFDDILLMPVTKDLLKSRVDLWVRRINESRMRLQHLVENTGVGLYRITGDGELLFANPVLCRLLGFRTLTELNQVPPEKHYFSKESRSSGFTRKMREKGRVEGFESTWIRADGESVTFLENAHEVRKNGRLLYIEGSLENITALKILREIITEDRDKYNFILDKLPIGLSVLDEQENYTYINPKSIELDEFGGKMEQLLGANVRSNHPKTVRHKLDDLLRKMKSGKLAHFERFAYRKHTVLHISYHAIRDSNNTYKGLIRLVADVTREKNAEAELKQSRNRWEATFNAISDWVSLVDLQTHRILQTNKAGGVFFDCPYEEIIGQTCYRLVHHTEEPLEDCPLERVRTSGRKESMEFYDSLHDRWLQITVDPIHNETGEIKAAVHIAKDITEWKKNEASAALLLEQQEVINRLSLEIGNAASLQEIFPVIKREIGVLVHSPALFISLYDRKNELITPVYINIEGDELDVSAFPPLPLEPEGMGVQSQVIRTGKSIIMNDWDAALQNTKTLYDIRTNGQIVKTNQAVKKEDLPTSALVVPMKSERQVFGIFMIQCKERHTYTNEDCNFLEGVANVTAVVVQNLKLVSDLDKQLKELRTAHTNLKRLLGEKEVLLKEVHHRVKNNMQVVYSLLNMQIHEMKDTGSIEVLQESQNRIRSMALVHEKLYDSEDQTSINAEDFIHTITQELMEVYDTSGRINCVIDVSEITLDINIAVPCGLVINEILSNAFKYAFPEGRRGTISILVTPFEDNSLKIQISDDGIGLPDGFDFQEASTMGMTLIRILVQGQLDGTITIDGKKGTTFDITCPLNPA